MKRLIILSIFISLASCKNDDVSENKGNISGNWKMVKYLGFVNELPTITKGDVIWNVNSNTITMTNNSPYPYVSTIGTYQYSWINNETIVINYKNSYVMHFKVLVTNQTLRLSEVNAPNEPETSDKIILEFEK